MHQCHIGRNRSVLPDILGRSSKLQVQFATDGAPKLPSYVYIAPPHQHMVIDGTLIRLTGDAKVHFIRPAADPLFLSAASSHGKAVLGIVLSGGGSDGAAGLRAIKEQGGFAVLQAPSEAESAEMPFAALLDDYPDLALTAAEIGAKLREFFAALA